MQVRDFLRADTRWAVVLLASTDTAGERRVNDRLAGRRAATVRSLLVREGGVAPARVFVAQLAETDLPLVTLDGKREPDNRTVRFLLVHLPERP